MHVIDEEVNISDTNCNVFVIFFKLTVNDPSTSEQVQCFFKVAKNL